MDTTLTVCIIIGIILAGFVLYTLLKGFMKMLFFGGALACSIVAYIWVQKYGMSYISCVTSQPETWMVTTLAISTCLGTFAVLLYGLHWLSAVFSWRKNHAGHGGGKGIITTILMVGLVVWVGLIALFYQGSTDELRYTHQRAMADLNRGPAPSATHALRAMSAIRHTPQVSWLAALDPLRDDKRMELTKLITYLASLEDADLMRVCSSLKEQGFPNTARIQSFSQNHALRKAISQGDWDAVINNTGINTILTDQKIRAALEDFPITQFIGGEITTF